MKKNLILIVDDEKETKKVLFEDLSKNGYSIFLAENAERALHLFEQKSFDLVIINTKLPDRDGLELLNIIKEKSIHTPVMMMSSFGTIQNAVEAMKKGALDYLPKPVPLETLQEKIQMILNNNFSHPEIHQEEEFISHTSMPILTNDKRMKEALDLCQRVASSKASVLIQGESGTGKELFARYIHAKSSRREGPFVAINCASLPESLFVSEIIGNEKGALKGANLSWPRRGPFF
jgi:two-component system response regulator FlrC